MIYDFLSLEDVLLSTEQANKQVIELTRRLTEILAEMEVVKKELAQLGGSSPPRPH
jgi:hypothetical protein